MPDRRHHYREERHREVKYREGNNRGGNYRERDDREEIYREEHGSSVLHRSRYEPTFNEYPRVTRRFPETYRETYHENSSTGRFRTDEMREGINNISYQMGRESARDYFRSRQPREAYSQDNRFRDVTPSPPRQRYPSPQRHTRDTLPGRSTDIPWTKGSCKAGDRNRSPPPSSSKGNRDKLPRYSTDFPQTKGSRKAGDRNRSPPPSSKGNRDKLPRYSTDFPQTGGSRPSAFRHRSPSPEIHYHYHYHHPPSFFPNQHRYRSPSPYQSRAGNSERYAGKSSEGEPRCSSRAQSRESWGRESRKQEAPIQAKKERDLYEVLGLERGCSEDAIKKAFRWTVAPPMVDFCPMNEC